MTPNIDDEKLSGVLKDFFIKFFVLGESNASSPERYAHIWTGGKLKVELSKRIICI